MAADAEMADLPSDEDDLVVPRVLSDAQFHARVHKMVEQRREAGYIVILNSSAGMRARGIDNPEWWSIRRQQTIENRFRAYLEAREHNPHSESTPHVHELFEAARTEWRSYVMEMLNALIPEFLGVDFSTFYVDRELRPAYHMYRLALERTKKKKTMEARKTMATQFDMAEVEVLQGVANRNQHSARKLDIEIEQHVTQKSFDMRPKHASYETHVARLVKETLTLMDDNVIKVVQHLLSAFQAQLASGLETEMYQLSRNAVKALVTPLQRAIFFLTMHLMDDIGGDGDHILDRGRFGRANNWAATTGVSHGQWPGPKRPRSPEQTQTPTTLVDLTVSDTPSRSRSRTPSPTPVNTRKPPKTQRLSSTRHARTNVSNLASVRRSLTLSLSEPSDDDGSSGSSRSTS